MSTTTYSKVGDLLHGDIPLPQRHGDGQQMVEAAAEDIDAQIGHIYVTPIQVDDEPRNRPTRLLLKKINNYIASGRIMLDMAAASEDTELHAYGLRLLIEGQELLARISSGEIALTGVEELEPDPDEKAPARLYILNEDPESLVKGFYERTNGHSIFTQGVLPYGEPA